MSTGIDNVRELGLRIYPDPVRDGLLSITGIDARVIGITVYDAGGRKVADRAGDEERWSVRLPGTGTFLVVVRTKERSFVKRVVSI
jgi:hypothetical protein